MNSIDIGGELRYTNLYIINFQHYVAHAFQDQRLCGFFLYCTTEGTSCIRHIRYVNHAVPTVLLCSAFLSTKQAYDYGCGRVGKHVHAGREGRGPKNKKLK